MDLASDVRAYLETLAVSRPTDKAAVRQRLLVRKHEQLLRTRATLLPLQRQALALLARVDYTRIAPTLRLATTPRELALWRYFRGTLSSAPWSGRVGRQLYGFCLDARSGGVLGIIDLGSDMAVLPPRDRHIGWTYRDRLPGGGLRHVINVGTCVCAAPFGLLTGGKYQIRACLSSWVATLWQRRYGSIAAGLGTTALYGRSSVYNRVPNLRYLGTTPGQGADLSSDGLRLCKRFLADQRVLPRRTGLFRPVRSRWDVLQRVCKLLGYPFDRAVSCQPRGVYFGTFGHNAEAFLRRETATLESCAPSLEEVAAWWQSRWYAMRWPKVRAEVEAFDPSLYGVDEQIERARVGGRSAESGTRDNQPEGLDDSSRPLQEEAQA